MEDLLRAVMNSQATCCHIGKLTCETDYGRPSKATESVFDAFSEFCPHGKRVAAWLRGLIERCVVSDIVLGKEYSPVIYLTVSNWDRRTKSLRSDSAKAKLLDKLKKEAKAFDPDEIMAEVRQSFPVAPDDRTLYVLRLWWD